MVHTDEEDLIRRASGGDQQALEGLLYRYYDRLAAMVGRRIPAALRGVLSAEDILQQAFIEIFQHIETFKPAGQLAFFRWAATITRRRLQDVIKAHKTAKRGGDKVQVNALPQVTADSISDLLDVLAVSEGTPSRIVSRHEAAGALHVALASMKEEYRRVIQLRHIEGLSVAQIATTLDKTESAIHSLCHRALNELRMILGESARYLSRK